MLLPAGTCVGPYKIVAPLGTGGMGEVYKARDTRLNRTVAIKILPPDMAADPQRRERFRREARAISSLTHPHICTLHDIGEQDGVDFLVMECLEGETLAHRLLRGALPLEEVLRIGGHLADALDGAHRAGIVHRDLKPANVMLTAGGAKVLDFGVAKWHGGDPDALIPAAQMTTNPTLTQVGSVVGTVQYMAPEQVEGKPVDARTDLFALGSILYEMTTGRKAFEGTSSTTVMAAILTSAPPPMATVQPVTPPALDRVVRKCLAKDPARRWQTAADLRDALAWIEDDATAPAAPSTSTKTPTARKRRDLAVVVPIAVLALAAAVYVGVRWVLYVRASPPESRLITLSVQPAEGTTFDTIAVSPDGHMLAFTAADASGKTNLWIRALESSNARILPGTEGAEFPFWSPDSRYVGYAIHRRLQKIAVSGGPPQTILGTEGTILDSEGARGATWGRDGVIVFASGTFSPLLRVSADGGDPVPLTTLDASRQETSHRWPCFLPDGRHYLFTIRSGQRDVHGIYLGAIDSSERTRLAGDLSNAAYATSSSGAGYVLFTRGRSLMAQPFDASRLRLTGDAMVVAENVWYSSAWAHASYSVSQDGVLVLDSTSRGHDVVVTWFDRSGARRDTVGEFTPNKFSLSPNGTQLALDSMDPQTGNFKLWTVDLRRGVSERFTPGSKDAEELPVWSPDGARIAFGSTNTLLERSSSGIGEDSVLLKSDRRLGPLDWSRDGRFLLYRVWASSPSTKGDLWALPMNSANDRKPFPVVQSSIKQPNGAFSPDGKWIAYDSDESGVSEVYVRAFSTSGSPSKWQVSKGGGLNPQWRGDGKELFYLAADSSTLMAVQVTTGTTFEAEVPRPLFAGHFKTGITAQFNVTADGQRFLITVPMAADNVSPATIVFNWPGLLNK